MSHASREARLRKLEAAAPVRDCPACRTIKLVEVYGDDAVPDVTECACPQRAGRIDTIIVHLTKGLHDADQ